MNTTNITPSSPKTIRETVIGFILEALTSPQKIALAPLTGWVVTLLQLTRHPMYHRALASLLIGSILAGITIYHLWGSNIPMLAAISAAFMIPLLWGDLIFGRIITTPYAGWGYTCPDTKQVYWICVAYTALSHVPSMVASILLICKLFSIWLS